MGRNLRGGGRGRASCFVTGHWALELVAPVWENPPVRPPDVRYAATTDGTEIAYLDFGQGEPIVWIPGLIGNIEICWEQEMFRRFMLHQADHARMLPFDKRGIGQSGEVGVLPTLEDRLADVAAVLNAAGVERAHLHGVSEGALIAAHFAASHPERVQRLVLGNMVPGPGRFNEYGDRVVQIFEYVAGRMLDDWGRDGAELVHWFMRSQVGNADVEAWAARFARFTASPAMMRRQIESLSQVPSPPLEHIRAPTLVFGTTDDPFVPAAVNRRTADLIPGARYAEIDGADHYYFLGPLWRESCDLALEFMLDRSLVARPTSMLATVLFTDLVASTSQARDAGDGAWRETVDSHNRIGRELVREAEGVYVKSTGDGLLAYFSTPSAGILCARRSRGCARHHRAPDARWPPHRRNQSARRRRSVGDRGERGSACHVCGGRR